MNSASVAGGVAPEPEHSVVPELQSPVWQVNLFVVGSVEQSVLPQIRPDQDGGIGSVVDWSGDREKPVVVRGGVPAPERSPG